MDAVKIETDGNFSLFGYPVIRFDDYPHRPGLRFLDWTVLTEFDKLGPLTSQEAEKYRPAALRTVFTCRRCNRPVKATRLFERDAWEGDCLCGTTTEFSARLAGDAVANYCAHQYMIKEHDRYVELHEIETGERWTTRMLESIAKRLREGRTGGERTDS